MLFNSWGYLLFLFVCVGLYWSLPQRRLRIGLVSIASIAFYAIWRWEFSLLVVFSAFVDFFVSKRIAAATEVASRKKWLLCSLIINLGLLVVFKYTYFIYDNISIIAGAANTSLPALNDLGIRIILPLGISFYTFQTISYSIDVYRQTIEPLDDFVLFTAYVMFWPQLIAGPILRAGEVLPELDSDKKFSVEDFAAGFERIVVGLFKKVVFADTLALVVDPIFTQEAALLTAVDVWVAAFLFGFQIYFDFSGYSDVAIGSARLLGIKFPENFNWPYVSNSPKDFWGRWHISLGSWIRDYLYLPLTGQKFQTKSQGGLVGATMDKKSADRALFLTWLIMGFWHGAAWTFALWGVYHAVWIFAYRRFVPLKNLSKRAPLVAIGLMLLISMAGWLPFRANSVADTMTMFGTLLNPFKYTLNGHRVTIYSYALALLLTMGQFGAYYLQKVQLRDSKATIVGLRIVRQALMICAILICLERVQTFIYFQF